MAYAHARVRALPVSAPDEGCLVATVTGLPVEVPDIEHLAERGLTSVVDHYKNWELWMAPVVNARSVALPDAAQAPSSRASRQNPRSPIDSSFRIPQSSLHLAANLRMEHRDRLLQFSSCSEPLLLGPFPRAP